ncbi:hypothetical protein AB0H12_38660 [Actinosynnema sp. NPDC023794]
MDEPLSNPDASLGLRMRSEIRRLHQSLGLTAVYVTHDQEPAPADRLVVPRDGAVQQVGSPEEVNAHPRNQYVAGFMGYRSLLTASVTSVAGERATASLGGVPLTGVNRDGLPPCGSSTPPGW